MALWGNKLEKRAHQQTLGKTWEKLALWENIAKWGN